MAEPILDEPQSHPILYKDFFDAKNKKAL